MANLKYAHVWKLLEEHDFQIKFKSFPELMCLICNKLLRNASQSPCGCRYCHVCIKKYLNGKEKCCPGKGEDCKSQILNLEKDIQFDLVANKKVSMIEVECPENYCQFKCELRYVEDHLKAHKFKCPFFYIGCDSFQINQDFLKDHLNEDSSHHTNLLMDSIHNMQNEIDCLKEAIKSKDQLMEKMTQKMRKIKNDMKSLTQTILEDSQKKDTFINQLMRENLKLSKIANSGDNVSESSGNHDQGFAAMKRQNKKRNDKIVNGRIYPDFDTGSISSQSSLSTQENYAPFEWKIEAFSQKRAYAQLSINTSLYSEPFYSGLNQYKFRLRIHPNGINGGLNTHLSIFFEILHGEFDEMLHWPMPHQVSIVLIDQVSGLNHKSKIYSVHKTEKSLRCAYYDSSNRYGRDEKFFVGDAEFINLDDLIQNTRLCVKGSIVIKCFIDPITNR